MSRFLSIECDPIDQPAAIDPVERRTWCRAEHPRQGTNGHPDMGQGASKTSAP